MHLMRLGQGVPECSLNAYGSRHRRSTCNATVLKLGGDITL